MCRVIDPEHVLVNLMVRGWERITICDLKDFRHKIEATVPDVFVDVSEDSICEVLETLPTMFVWDGDEITRAQGADEFFKQEFVDRHFNWKLPQEVREGFLSALTTS